ncbi:MAG TPA: hypothetical protein VJ721_03510 [Chthoniobacterales bacterium]|nr:hypothetical protein [Chthoniobacterales bacterium]
MRRVSPLAVPLFLCAVTTAFASEIREFDIKTLERLGNELTKVSQTRDKGATTPERKLARQTAAAALKGKLFDIHYDYVVLDDPNRHNFLIYALGKAEGTDQVVMAGHFRVTVSLDGTKAERVDALSKSLARSGPITAETAALFLIQLVSNKPAETLIYTSNLAKKPVYVRTPDGTTWVVNEGKMRVAQSKPTSSTSAPSNSQPSPVNSSVLLF